MNRELLVHAGISRDIKRFLQEDDVERNLYYNSELPEDMVECSLKLKDNLIVAGIPYLKEVFFQLGVFLDNSLDK